MNKSILTTAILMAFAGVASSTSYGTITIDNSSAEASQLTNEKNGVVKLVGNADKYALLADSDFSIRGKEIHFERLTKAYTEAVRVSPKGNGIIGGKETVLVSVMGGDGLVLIPTKGGATFPTLTVTAWEFLNT